jgi:hypothetical protein
MSLGANIMQCDTLHAKVYLSEKGAVVTSANASANGLGFEGAEQGNWIEAGTSFEDIESIVRWFDRQWKEETRKIEESDLKTAKNAHRQNRRRRPSLNDFRDFDPTITPMPLVSWWPIDDNRTIILNDRNKKAPLFRTDEVTKRRIRDGVDIEGRADKVALKLGTWILWWCRKLNGEVSIGKGVHWECTGEIVQSAFKYKGGRKWLDRAARAEDPPAVPFDVGTRKFLKDFSEVMNRPEFHLLRNADYKGAWFTHKRIEKTREFWSELRMKFIAKPGDI